MTIRLLIVRLGKKFIDILRILILLNTRNLRIFTLTLKFVLILFYSNIL